MATGKRLIATSSGPKFGDVFRPLEILGISSYLTQTGNQPNGYQYFDETIIIDVPLGTYTIVPVPNWWELGHGTLDPEFIDPNIPNPNATMTVTDRPWALGDVRVSVFTINPVDHSQDVPVQTAEVHVLATLIDYNADDPWFGFVGFTLLFLGRGPAQEVNVRQFAVQKMPLGPTPMR